MMRGIARNLSRVRPATGWPMADGGMLRGAARDMSGGRRNGSGQDRTGATPRGIVQVITHRLRCERRRLAVVVTLAFAAGYLLYAQHLGVTVAGLPAPVLTGLLYAGLIGPAALVTSVLLPGLRIMTEAVALSRLTFASWVALAPESGQAVAAMPLVNASIVVGGAILLCWTARRLADPATLARLPAPAREAVARARLAHRWLDHAERRRGAEASGCGDRAHAALPA